jgi:hypothetical protein
MAAIGPRPFVKLASTALVLALLAGSANAQRTATPVARVAPSAHAALRASGHVRGLYPGAVTWMRVTVRNVTKVRLRVTELRATVGTPNDGCLSSMLRVRPLRSQPVVAAHGSIKVRVRVRLRRIAPDACQGVRFPLTFSAKAVAA